MVCVDCLEAVADVAEPYAERVDFNAVTAALLARSWRAGSLACRGPRGFTLRPGGGGTWPLGCPLCVEQRFEAPKFPRPRSLWAPDPLPLLPRGGLALRTVYYCNTPTADGLSWRGVDGTASWCPHPSVSVWRVGGDPRPRTAP